jgi:histidinol-phosphate aminotransferase
MALSRRSLIRRLGVGAAVAAVANPEPWLQASVGAAVPATSNQPDPVLRLNTTHNAYGPSARTVAAMREALGEVNGSVDTAAEQLRHRIAWVHAVRPEQVVLGCGAGDILRMAAVALTTAQARLIVALPTFDLIARYALRAGTPVVPVPLNQNHAHNLDAMLEQCDRATGLVYVCNPNNPTGSLTCRKDLEAFLAALPQPVHVVIDEAYHHYVEQTSDYVSFIDRPVDDPRVIVVRSFSKVFGLAGLRIGYGITAPATAHRLTAARLEGSVNVVAARAAAAALEDAEHVRDRARLNANDRQEFLNQANARMLRAIDSHTNFVMLNAERPASQVVDHFARHDILLARPTTALPEHVRVSLGTPAEMQAFWRVWDLMPIAARHKM